MRLKSVIAVMVMVLHETISLAQVSTVPPKAYTAAMPLGLGPETVPYIQLSNNTSELIRDEILDSNLVELIGKSVGLAEEDKNECEIAPDPIGAEIWFYTLTNNTDPAVGRFRELIGTYIQARLEGHTKSCLLSGLSNPYSGQDTNRAVLARHFPLLPVSEFKLSKSGITTNNPNSIVLDSNEMAMVIAGKLVPKNKSPKGTQLLKWFEYTFVDGKVCWKYTLTYNANGSFRDIHVWKFDAQELDPALKATFQAVDQKLKSEMINSGELGKLGAIQDYWFRKKMLLKRKGIDWLSPAELNGGIFE